MSFSTLSASEQNTLVSKLRLHSGDHISPFQVTPEEMQLCYDAEDGDYNKTVVAVLRLLIDKLSAHTEMATDKRQTHQIERRLKELCDEKLPYWLQQAGVLNGGATIRTLDTGIDSYDDSMWS